MADNEFQWWQNALAGKRGQIHDGEPQSGYYRQRTSHGKPGSTAAGPWEPVAYWKDSATGEQRCHVNGRAIGLQRALEMWPFVSKNPITDAAYWHRIDTGKWLDEDEGAAATRNGPDIDPETDPVGSMKAEIEKAAAGAVAYKTIDSDEQSAKAQTLRSALTALSGKADKARKAEKEPHLQAGRDVDAKWQPLVNQASTIANDIRRAMEAWENVKRDNARLAAHAAEKAAREAQEAGKPAPPPPAQNTPAPAMQIRGASGGAASVGTRKEIKSIDLQKCWEKLGGLPEVYNLFMDLADKAISAGRCTAEELGAVIEEKANVR
jgi:hypothetical protein